MKTIELMVIEIDTPPWLYGLGGGCPPADESLEEKTSKHGERIARGGKKWD